MSTAHADRHHVRARHSRPTPVRGHRHRHGRPWMRHTAMSRGGHQSGYDAASRLAVATTSPSRNLPRDQKTLEITRRPECPDRISALPPRSYVSCWRAAVATLDQSLDARSELPDDLQIGCCGSRIHVAPNCFPHPAIARASPLFPIGRCWTVQVRMPLAWILRKMASSCSGTCRGRDHRDAPREVGVNPICATRLGRGSVADVTPDREEIFVRGHRRVKHATATHWALFQLPCRVTVLGV